MRMRLAGTLVLVAGIAALASASAYAGNGNGSGNGNGNGNAKNEPAAASAAAETQGSGHGNSANAPGQVKKDEEVQAATPAVSGSPVAQDVGPAQTGVKPSNDTAHDTHAAASSDQTKLYGNGKTAGQIAIENGAAPSTVLHGPGNSQPHKVAPCAGGHEVDVHALKGKRGKGCGRQPLSPPPTPRPNPTPDPGRPGDPVRDQVGNTPAVTSSSPSASSPAAQSLPSKTKTVVSPQHGSVEMAGGVLSATGVTGAGTLPFTGFPTWVVMLIALALIVLGLMLRRRSSASSS
jgi:hypothetical protein